MNDLTAYDFWGNATWVGGTDEERCKRLRLYEKTGMEPEEIKAMQKANEAYRLAGLRYEEEIVKFRQELGAAVKDLKDLASGESPCNYCTHEDDGYTPLPSHCKYVLYDGSCWEWRGVCEENVGGGENAVD